MFVLTEILHFTTFSPCNIVRPVYVLSPMNCCISYAVCRAGFPKVGHDRYSGGNEQQRGQRGGMGSKGATGGHEVII